VFRPDATGRAEDEGVFDAVLQFPDVARVVVAHEHGQGGVGKAGDGLAGHEVLAFDEGGREQRDILGAFPQGRQHDPGHAQAVEEIAPEGSRLGHGRQIPVGGRDHPDIGRQAFFRAEGLVDALLEHAQELDLERQGQLPHFVEKKRASGRQGEPALAGGLGVGKRPLGVAEEFRFEEFARYGAAVDRHERTVLAGTQIVDGPGEEFLAGAGFAKEQHA